MKEVNIHLTFEMDLVDNPYEYEDSSYEENDVEITASFDLYEMLLSNANYDTFESFMIYFCGEYGLSYAGNHTSPHGSIYYDFYNFDNESNCHVNLIVEVRVSNHWKVSRRAMAGEQSRVARIMNDNEEDLPELFPINIIFERNRRCKSVEEAYILLQRKLREVSNMYRI